MKAYILILAIPVLLACSQKKEETAAASESIEGSTWQTGCTANGSLYDVRSSNFTGGQFTMSATAYSDSGCSLALIKNDATGSYIISGTAETTNYVMVDETIATITLTAMSSSIVTYFNTNAYCGFTDWALGVAKNLAGVVCDGVTVTSAGTTGYDIYYAANGILNFGLFDASHDGLSTAARPVSLDSTFNFVKQ